MSDSNTIGRSGEVIALVEKLGSPDLNPGEYRVLGHHRFPAPPEGYEYDWATRVGSKGETAKIDCVNGHGERITLAAEWEPASAL